MSDKVSLAISMPLDSDGFLRRECPTCERELKWRPTPEGEEPIPVPDGGYFCPYCGIQAAADTWLTKAQVELVHATVASEVVDPMLKKFGDDIGRISRRSGGIISASVQHRPSPKPAALTESDDMTRVNFSCHPTEPVKVLDDWAKPVRCLVCGADGPTPSR